MTATRNAQGVYTKHHGPDIKDTVKRLFERGDTYNEIADAVSRKFNIRFNKNNVASMINRFRRRGLIEPTNRVGGRKPRGQSINDGNRKPAPITLVKV